MQRATLGKSGSETERVEKHLANGRSLRLSFYLDNEKKVSGTEVLKMIVTRFKPPIFRLQVQRATTEPPIPAAETTANLCYLCTNLINVYCS